jgi:hypothetical protein
MAAHAEPDRTETTPQGASILPRVPQPADTSDVMREQLEYLIGHASETGTCGCSDCQRYLRVQSVLLEIFREPEPQSVGQLAVVPMAA